jgi:hypothetical protein
MKFTKMIGIATLAMFALTVVPQSSFAKVVTEKKKMTVTVGGDCGGGVSVSDGSSGNSFCASYPRNAIGMLRAHAGQTIEIEAVFQYPGDPKSTSPTGIRSVSKVAGIKVYDPCSTGKMVMWGALAGMSHTPVGAAGLPPGCAESLDPDGTAADDQQ